MSVFVIGIALASNYFINQLREKETKKIKVFATAMQYLQEQEFDSRLNDLCLKIIEENDEIPVIITNEKKNPLDFRNIPEEVSSDPEKLKKSVLKMGNKYEPFKIQITKGNNQLVFYDNSRLMNYLKFYPFLLALFIGGYLLFSFWFLRTLKKTDEGFVWAGLAKETAHQIGTPLSSMIGWNEIMKLENPNSQGLHEIDKDINRLKTISERFSKIGSVPELNDKNLNETVQQNFDYLKTRISTKVNFSLNLPKKVIEIPHNRILMSWVIENLVKNAVDAMKGKGNLEISLYEKNKNILIDFKDNGCGMTAQQARNVFKPGYSTKSRGWGLGLSLAKRVITEYHKGDIKIAQTEVGKGTTFRIVMRKS